MSPQISKFWIRWMIVVLAGMVVMGLMIIFTPFVNATLGSIYYNVYFDYDAYAVISDGDLRFQTFLYGVMGAVLASWSLLMLSLVIFPIRQGQKWAWYAMIASIILWFIGDGYASVVTGFPIHAAINLSMLITLGIPLLAIYRQLR